MRKGGPECAMQPWNRTTRAAPPPTTGSSCSTCNHGSGRPPWLPYLLVAQAHSNRGRVGGGRASEGGGLLPTISEVHFSLGGQSCPVSLGSRMSSKSILEGTICVCMTTDFGVCVGGCLCVMRGWGVRIHIQKNSIWFMSLCFSHSSICGRVC